MSVDVVAILISSFFGVGIVSYLIFRSTTKSLEDELNMLRAENQRDRELRERKLK